MKHKMCVTCGQIRKIEQFHRDKKNRDGRKRECIFCNDPSPKVVQVHMDAMKTANWQLIIQRKLSHEMAEETVRD